MAFWEIVYPKESHEDVMKMLMPFDQYVTSKIGKGLYFILLPFMKALGIKKNHMKSVGKYNNFRVHHPYVDVVVFGHKEDRIDKDGTQKI